MPICGLLLRPVRVQGEGAASEIAEAIADLNRHGAADVLIVGRGGGSIEDLWAFNEEIVARAIHASALPVISAVGHETDFTIADFVADLRAPTPSAAAEMVVRSRLELENHLDHLALRLGQQMDGRLQLMRERVENLGRRLVSPRQELLRCRQRQEDLARRLLAAMDRRRSEAEGRLGALAGRLDALSPLRTLDRGYAIVFAEKNGRAVRQGNELVAGDRVRLRFAAGGAGRDYRGGGTMTRFSMLFLAFLLTLPTIACGGEWSLQPSVIDSGGVALLRWQGAPPQQARVRFNGRDIALWPGEQRAHGPPRRRYRPAAGGLPGDGHRPRLQRPGLRCQPAAAHSRRTLAGRAPQSAGGDGLPQERRRPSSASAANRTC